MLPKIQYFLKLFQCCDELEASPLNPASVSPGDLIHQCNYKEAAASNPVCGTVRSALDNAALICNEIIPAAWKPSVHNWRATEEENISYTDFKEHKIHCGFDFPSGSDLCFPVKPQL